MKYDQVIDLLNQHKARIVDVKQENNITKLRAEVDTQYTKNIIWDKIKQVGGENPRDIQADITVSNNRDFAVHKVEKGETLSEIAKKYLGDANKYRDIASYNNISNPDKINVGQEIRIPNLESVHH